MTKKEEPSKLTEQEVFNVLEFASILTSPEMQSRYNVYTPEMVHDVLNKTNMNTLQPTIDLIKIALNNPNDKEEELQAYSEWFYNNSMTYRNTIDYLGNMLAFDITYTTNACDDAYDSDEYKNDVKIVNKFIKAFQPKREFSKIVKNLLRQETVFTSFRDEAGQYGLQQLPSKYCKITGYTPSTFLFDFNLYYFLQPAVDIKLYSKQMAQYYVDTFKDDGDDNYIPSNPLTNRKGEFVLWHQTSPDDNFWCFKFSPEIFTKIPHLAPLMADLKNVNVLRDLQLNKDIAAAKALVAGEIPFLDNLKSGQKADQLALSPQTLATFLGLVKKGLDETWSLAGLPLERLQMFEYEDKNPDMYTNQLSTTASQGVSASRIIYTSDKMSQEETLMALETDGNLMRSLYQQFEDFLNFYVNKKTRKYKFYFHFEGLNYSRERQKRIDNIMTLANVGLVLEQKIAAAYGIEPQDWQCYLEQTKHGNVTNLLTSLQSIHTASQNSSGRPQQEEVVTATREYDNNNEE